LRQAPPSTEFQQAAEQSLRAAHQALLKTPGLQFEFEAFTQPPQPHWLDGLGRFLQAISPFLRYVFWGGLALAVGLLAFFVGRELLRVRFERRRRSRAAEAVADWRPEPARAKALLQDADALAAAGRYGEAAHLLLFRSIDDLAVRKPGLVRPALTSRDIAAMDAVPPAPRTAFARIAAVVERGVFGGRAVDAGQFAECRAAYEAFAFAEAWR